ncbi:MAG: amino acid adenylation domain-containing protein [Acidobacteriota bacterium]
MRGENRAEGDLFGVAIVGMAGRFPGAPDLGAFWRNLRSGVESIRFFDDDELRAAGVPEELIEHPRYVKAGSVLEDIDQFDARFFGYGPGEAALIDPQQRLLLETAWWALENAGYDAKAFDGPIGVFAGSTLSSYLLHLALNGGPGGGGLVSSASAGPAFMGNSPDFLATRVAYKLDLQGPAYSVHTACSTSLVAVHLACQALLAYETDIALAGGVSVRVPHDAGYLSEESGITSPDGHTRPFDAAGRGTVFGNGVGMVVLRRLEDALADGDRVLAVIRGSATNNDGSVKVGFTAPSLGAQARVIAEALAAADVDPATVSYVEAHGTGTELGDPIEVAALSRAFGEARDRSVPCALGSVKSNIGHLDAAAGVSGLIKTVLMLRHREIPPSLHFETPNPKIDFAGSPFEVATERRPWTSSDGPLRAGVSSFGFGGTNVHLVLEEAPAPEPRPVQEQEQLWLLSARTETALATSAERLAEHLLAREDLDPNGAAFTLQVGRRALAERRAVVATGREEAAAALRAGQGHTFRCDRDDPPVVFLFSGQGSQYAGMGRELYESEPVYRRWIDRAAEAFAAGDSGDGAPFDLEAILGEADDEVLRRTANAQPALFAVEHALARLWMSWGIRPAAVLGHSIGEIAAAVIAGHLPFEGAARMVVERGRAMEACESGAMLAVALAEGAVAERLAGTALEIAAVNGPAAVVVSGPDDEIAAFAAALAGERIDIRPLHTSHAFHSRSMEPAAEALRSFLALQDLAVPEGERVPLVSNLSGGWISAEELAAADYWARQIRRPVRFGAGLETALAEHDGVLLEVGPGNALGALARRHPTVRGAAGGERPVLSSLRHARRSESDRSVMLTSLGRLWGAGCRPNWKAVHGGDSRRVALPGYPFERQSYWVGGSASVATAGERVSEPSIAHQRPDLGRAFAVPETPTEETLAELWGELLGVSGVGRYDDFFELGGDSLIATRMLARVQDRLGTAIPLDHLFASPTVAGLAAQLPESSEPEAAVTIPRVDRSADLPLSFAQQSLWFLAHFDRTGGAYNLPGALRLRGPLDADRLVQALAAAVERHESLRTRFVGEEGRARQEILPQATLPLRRIDLAGAEGGEDDPLDRALALAAEDARQPFDLSRAPLGRALLIRLAAEDHLFQLTLHHIISDGWSWNVLRRELAAFMTGDPEPLPPLPVHYVDYAAWQRGAGEADKEMAFWRQRLSPLPPVLDLPTDRPRPDEPSFRGETLTFGLAPATVDALEGAARKQGATLFMALLAVFEVMLARLSGQHAFAVGSPVANRQRSELEGIVGFFVNSLVLRAELSDDPSFDQLLTRVRDDALEAYAHQGAPFDRLVDDLVGERSLAHTPIFQVMFGLHNTPPAGRVPGFEVEVLEPETGTAKFDLTVGLLAGPDGLFGSYEYSTDLFDRSSAERLLAEWLHLIDEVLAGPDVAFSELSSMTRAEFLQVVSDSNSTDLFWQRTLAGAAQALELPWDRPRGAQSGAASRIAGELEVHLTPAVARDLRRFADEREASLFTVLVAAFSALLGRYSGRNDLLLGFLDAQSHRAEPEAPTGSLVHPLALRVEFSGALAFAELVERVRETARAAYQHRDVPFDRLLELIDPQNELDRAAPFQVLVATRPSSPREPLSEGHRFPVGDLALEVRPNDAARRDDDAVSLAFRYSKELFDRSTVERLGGHLAQLLTTALEDPSLPLSRLPILEPAERRELIAADRPRCLDSGSDTGSYAGDAALHELFAQCASQTPDAIALTWGSEVMSYGRLAERAERLAHRLLAVGVRPGDRVGLSLERGLDLPVAILAILRAGAAYVPLDPTYPADRLAFIVSDSSLVAVVVVGEEAGAWLRDEHGDLPVIDLATPFSEQELAGVKELPPGDPDRLAYVIYTSGSTGRPKGVGVSHRAVVRLLETNWPDFAFDAVDVWTLFHSYAFDFSVWELWGALTYGGRLVVVPYWTSRQPREFARLLYEEQVTILNQTPSAFLPLIPEVIARREEWGVAPALRDVIFGGETLGVPLMKPWAECFGLERPRLVNMYGITETTVVVTSRPLVPADLEIGHRSPIGFAQRDLSLTVVDRWEDLAPIGVAGELRVGGPALAWGYLGRPALTAERFVPDPYSTHPGARLYRSGDLVRRLPDGDLDYLSRMDQQVKIRGFRIELGEIEAALAAHPSVREAAVIAHQPEDGGSTRLVAYVTYRDAPVDEDELLGHLAESLPEHMIPAVYVALDTLPLTPNGKLDRKALPEPEGPRSEGAGGVLETSAEVHMAEIWSEVLGVEKIGPRDNFFSLGGDSITSLQVVARAAAAGLRLDVRSIFRHPTLAALAAAADTAPDGDSGRHAEQGAVVGEYPLSPIQRWFFETATADPQHWNQSLILDVHEALDITVLGAAWADLVAHHDGLRARFEQGQEGWSVRIVASANPPQIAVFELESPAADGYRVGLQAVQESLDLVSGPLVGVGLFRFGDGSERLLLTAHHLVVDGYSWRVLLEDLTTAYAARLRGEEPILPPKTTSFLEWSRRVERQFDTSAEDGLWRDRELAEEPYPADFPAGDRLEASTVREVWELSEEATLALLDTLTRVTRAGIDELLVATLVAAFQQAQGKVEGNGAGNTMASERMRIDVEGHGRDLPVDGVDLSRTVGWFTALHPLDFDYLESGDTLDVLRRVKQGLRQAAAEGSGPGWWTAAGKAAAGSVLFNYLGRLDGLLPEEGPFSPTSGDTGPVRSPREERRYAFEVDAAVFDGRLRLTWNYSSSRYRAETVRALGDEMVSRLQAWVAEPPQVPCLVPADFPLAGLSADDLDRVLERRITPLDLYPLTPVQEGMLFHTLYQAGESGNEGVFVEQLTCELAGVLDLGRFQEAWSAVQERHPALATSFLWQGLDEPLQVVTEPHPAEVVVLEGEDENAFLAADRRRGLDLTQSPLQRWTLLRRADDSFLFVWTFHHLILDGWSAARVLAEVLEVYGGGAVEKLPPVAPFRGYLAWLAERDGGRDGEASSDFWRQELAGLQAPTPLGIDRTALQGRKGAGRGLAEIILPSELAGDLALAARRHQLTLATLLQAAWARLLSAYSGQREVVFGATVAGRPADLPGVESMVGLFINSLPVRLEVPATGNIVDWLTAVQERAVARRPHEHIALGRVQSLSGLPAGEPLYESLLVIENYPFDDSLREAGGLALGAPRFLEQTNEPLALMATPGEEFILRLAWDRARIPDDAGRRVLDHLRQVLEGLVDALAGNETESAAENDAVRPIDLDLLSSDERHRMLVEWNALAGEGYDASGLLQDRAEYWARETPDEIAVVGDGETMTYGALDRLANRLAWRLRDLGVGPDVAVGVSMERTPRLVAALHGILKAGGAYLPLDPAYPAERKATMMAQAEAPVLVTERSLAGSLEGPQNVLIEELTESDTGEAVTPFPCPATSENLAYVIYTSGSTGRPKGVMIPHRGVVNRLAYAPWVGHLRPGDRYIHKASLGFDVSVLEIFLPLYAGGRVVMARPGGHREPAYLAEVMRREGVHQGIFTPSLLRLLLDEEDFAGCDTLHSVVSGAEALPPELVERFYERTGAVLSNRYGPTEASIAASSWDCEPGAEEIRVPIGRPIARALLYVVDRQLRPLPPGVPGELVIGGPGLARGYLARPGLTAELFVPNPFPVPDSAGGERLYLTGDRVSIRADGAIEFLGRLDHQVKIRGHRVEPGEIEVALEDLDAVRRAVVIDRRDAAGTVRLVAYLEGEGAEPMAEELRQALDQRLPDYMVPAAFVVLGALPLNNNGKVDRSKLPDPSFDRADSGRSYVAPATPAEQALASVMEEVLGAERVGVEDDFFELGGDSILSIRVVSKARQVGYELNVRQIFEERTVRRLSGVAGEAAPEARAEQGPVTGEAPLTPVMARFFERPMPNPQWFNQALLLDLREAVPPDHLRRALAALVEHHDALRLRYERSDGEGRQWFGPVDEAALAFVTVDLGDVADEAANRRIAEHCAAAQGGLDLAAGPLVSAVYFTPQGGRPARLLLAVHHLAIDGFSWRVLAEDLETACRQLAKGEDLRLPLKTTSFKAWAEALHAAAIGGAFDDERDYWCQQVADAPGAEAGSEATGWGRVGEAEQVELRLSATDTAALVEEVPKAYDTGVDHAVLAAIGGVLQGDRPEPLRVALEGHGRDALAQVRRELDVSRTVGWFTTIFPVTFDLSGADGPLDRLVRVKETLRRVPTGGAGYGALRYLAGDRDGENELAVAPAPVLFNYLGRVVAEGSLLAPSGEDPGPTRDPAGSRRHDLDLDAVIEGDELVMRWRFHPEHRSEAEVRALAEAARADLRAMIEACRAPDVGGYTPSDFLDVELDQESLDSILAQVDGGTEDPGGER